MLRPKEIQARIRAGASVEQVAQMAGVDVGRVERFAHPVLLERARAAELAKADPRVRELISQARDQIRQGKPI